MGAGHMKLGLSIGYSGAELRLPLDRVLLAERLGFDSVWTAEAYGSDAITPLAYLAALTTRIRLGSGIMRVSGRALRFLGQQAFRLQRFLHFRTGRDALVEGLDVRPFREPAPPAANDGQTSRLYFGS